MELWLGGLKAVWLLVLTSMLKSSERRPPSMSRRLVSAGWCRCGSQGSNQVFGPKAVCSCNICELSRIKATVCVQELGVSRAACADAQQCTLICTNTIFGSF
eukprot:1144378-Pelagomonas_calceolata.AAC.5